MWNRQTDQPCMQLNTNDLKGRNQSFRYWRISVTAGSGIAGFNYTSFSYKSLSFPLWRLLRSEKPPWQPYQLSLKWCIPGPSYCRCVIPPSLPKSRRVHPRSFQAVQCLRVERKMDPGADFSRPEKRLVDENSSERSRPTASSHIHGLRMLRILG